VHRGQRRLPAAYLTSGGTIHGIAPKEQIDMSDPYLGQIEVFAFPFAPRNWAFCAGQLMSISQNQALFALLGTNFGGDGIRTFGLPDLRGHVAIGVGQEPGRADYVLGEKGGEESHTIAQSEMPTAAPHQHLINAIANDTKSGVSTPGGAMLGRGYIPLTGTPAVRFYSTSAPTVAMTPSNVAGGAPHENRMPFSVLNYCICLNGLFPERG
jgi:microcystin-dependent protein